MVKSYKNNGPVPLVYFGFLGSGSIFDGAQGQPNHFGVQGPGSKTSKGSQDLNLTLPVHYLKGTLIQI